MRYAIHKTSNNAHIMKMGNDGIFETIGFTAGDKESLEACMILLNLANQAIAQATFTEIVSGE